MISLLKQKTFLDFFPAPEFLLLSTTGIAITDIDTKFVQLRRKIFGDRFELAHASKVDNPKGAVESGLINNSDELVSILKKLASHYNIRYARASLPEEKAYLFTVNINWVPPEGLKDAVAFIIEENVPMSLAESVFDFEIINENESAGEIKLAVSVLPENIVNAYVGLFESALITPVSFDLESQAIARAVIRRGDKRPHLIINLSLKKTGFYVVEEEVVQFSTTSAYGVGGDDSYPNLNDLKAEMRKVFAFWNARTDDPLRQNSSLATPNGSAMASEASKSGQPGKKIEKAILCGLGRSRLDFVEKLMSESEVPYALADVWSNMSSPRRHVSEMPFDESLDYASVIGLVLPRDK
ncbi:MAG: pilus assembly protein PilM [bacterium]|nr:pilus assembly protein PilM [bacterium]